VPLIVHLPDSIAPPPQRVGALVSLTDVMPTLMARFELRGRELLLGQFEGEDVLSGTFARDLALVQRSADEVQSTSTGRELALLTWRWKFLRRADGADLLYDLAGAGEREDVSASHGDVAAHLRSEMDSILARKPALLEEASGPANAEVLKGLEDLGYVGEDE